MKSKHIPLILLSSLLLLSCTIGHNPALEKAFKMDQKDSDTKLYYSKKWHLGFTYLLENEQRIKAIEEGNKISLGEQFIEIYEKEPKETIAEAIEKEFLNGYDPEYCFVKVHESEIEGQQYARIDYPYPSSSLMDAPVWHGARRCPEKYTKTYKDRYFIIREDQPEYLIFVDLGGDVGHDHEMVFQKPIKTPADGSLEGKWTSWASSIQFFDKE